MEPEAGVSGRRAAATPRNIRIVVAYDGTPYLGWQVQPQGPTVQSVLQEAVHRITGEQVAVRGSGRTDAGVHALGQVANFHTSSTMSRQAFARAFNSVLPPAIVVLDVADAEPAFDSRFSARGKLYRYLVFNSAARSPFQHLRSWHVRRPLSLEPIETCCAMLLGRNDFSSFRAQGCSAASPVRHLTRCDVLRDGDVVSFELEADGFLRHMVRNIVGTLVDVGRGRFSTDEFFEIFHAWDRTRAGIAAPPHGLYLVRVDYPDSVGSAAPAQAPAPDSRPG